MDLLKEEKKSITAERLELGTQVEQLQADLQRTNYEKNRLKDALTGDKEFENLRQMVDRIQQMILM